MANFNDFEAQWKQGAADLASKSFNDFKAAAVADANAFLVDAKTDLIKWTGLLAKQLIDKDEFETLVGSDSVLLEMHSLKQAGLAQARWDSFTNGIIDLTVSTAVKETFRDRPLIKGDLGRLFSYLPQIMTALR